MTVSRFSLRIAAILITGSTCHAFADEIYKTVDAQGHVTYSDHALSPQSKRVTLDVVEGDPVEAARLAKEQALVSADTAQQAKLSQQRAVEQQKQEAQKSQQQRKCKMARDRFATFAAGGRIFKVDEQGNRVYYTDEEIDAQRDSAKAAMDSACSQ
jgi:Domain of unknown function (DUF4124)